MQLHMDIYQLSWLMVFNDKQMGNGGTEFCLRSRGGGGRVK